MQSVVKQCPARSSGHFGLVLWGYVFSAGLQVALSAVTVGDEVTIGDRVLRVAEGFEVSLAVDSALVGRPIALARDEAGYLYVTDSGGMSERAEKQLELKPHSIRRLEDTDGDGCYDRSVLFADRMMFPEGCMWYEGSLYVAAPPEIWKLTDTNGDGTADTREVWFDGKTLTGCGNDLHGPYFGHDGRFYWCKGAFAEQKHVLSDGSQLVTQSSHIFRARPDGSELESVLTGGMDNPVNVAFLNNGERFLSCTFFQNPENGRRDGLIHAIYGGVYGKKHASIYAHPMTGDIMPVLNHQGAAAPCGLIAGSRSLFGGGYEQTLFACYFNLHNVIQHTLVPNGPTYTTIDTELLGCDHPDFHPTDVFEDADGSLLIVDTGGWYKVCCPTSQLAKPDVLGAIYRVRRKDQTPVIDPLGHAISRQNSTPEKWCKALADTRLFVRRRAVAALRGMGTAAVPALAEIISSHSSADVRRDAVWTLAGIDISGHQRRSPAAGNGDRVPSSHESALSAIAAALGDEDPSVRQAAAHTAGLWRIVAAVPALLRAAADDDAGVARAATEALGRMQRPDVVPDLLRILSGSGIDLRDSTELDQSGAPAEPGLRIREHALIFALIETGSSAELRGALKSESAAVTRAALVALDQMRAGDLTAADVIPCMSDSRTAVKRTAAWIVNRNPDWGGSLAEYLSGRRAHISEMSDEEREEFCDLLASLTQSPEIQKLLVTWLHVPTDDTVQRDGRRLVLQVFQRSGLSAAPSAWFDSLALLLSEKDPGILEMAVAAAQSLPMPKGGHAELSAVLVRIAGEAELPQEIRLNAIDAAGSGIMLDDGTFRLLISSLDTEMPMSSRSIAADRLASSRLTDAQLQELVTQIRRVGPMELPRILPAFERPASDDLGMSLVESLLDAEGVRGLRPDLLRPVFAKYSPAVQDAGKAVIRLLNAGEEEQAQQLEAMLKSLPDGDVRRGHEVFMSRKAACNSCHKLGYGGGSLGPDLTSIGRVRNRRDLLEAIIFPSAGIVRGYEPVSVEIDDGRVISGIITSEDAREIVLSPDAQKTFHIDRSSIVSIRPSSVSPMPNGLATLLSAQEIADVIAFLLSDQR